MEQCSCWAMGVWSLKMAINMIIGQWKWLHTLNGPNIHCSICPFLPPPIVSLLDSHKRSMPHMLIVRHPNSCMHPLPYSFIVPCSHRPICLLPMSITFFAHYPMYPLLHTPIATYPHCPHTSIAPQSHRR